MEIYGHHEIQRAFDNRDTVRALVQIHDPVLHTVTQQHITVNCSKNDNGLMLVSEDGKHWYAPISMRTYGVAAMMDAMRRGKD